MKDIDHLWLVKKLKKSCFGFGTCKKRFIIRNPESIHSVTEFDILLPAVDISLASKRRTIYLHTYDKNLPYLGIPQPAYPNQSHRLFLPFLELYLYVKNQRILQFYVWQLYLIALIKNTSQNPLFLNVCVCKKSKWPSNYFRPHCWSK